MTAIADKVRDQLIAAELQRGDLPASTTPAVQNVSSTTGVVLVTELLRLLGDAVLVRGFGTRSDSRDAVFSRLVRICFPAPADTPATLIDAAREAGLPEARLVDLAIYAPQWAPLVEAGLAWPELASGVLAGPDAQYQGPAVERGCRAPGGMGGDGRRTDPPVRGGPAGRCG